MSHATRKNRGTRSAAGRALRLAALAALVLLAPAAARAATYTVTKTSMGGSSTGRLDTAINSANSNPGPDTIAFNIPTSDAGYDAARGVWRITLTSALPSITGDVTIDGTTQTAARGNTNTASLGSNVSTGTDAVPLALVPGPEIELYGTTSINGLTVFAGSLTLKSLAFLRFISAVEIQAGAADGSSITGCVFGTRANALAQPGADAITFGVNSQRSVTVSQSLFAYTSSSGLSAGGFLTATSNEFFSCYRGLAFAGSGGLAENNYVSGSTSVGADTSTSGATTLRNNTLSNNGTASTTSNQGVTISGGTAHVVERNVIRNSYGAGVVVYPTAKARITRNSIWNNGAVGIDLLKAGETAGLNSPYYTTNDPGDADAGGNDAYNFPVLTSAAISGGNLTVSGYARAGAVIELFVAFSDPSGFGEGWQYAATLTEGSGADADGTTGSYSGTVNGLNQGSDTANKFSFTIATPSGVSANTVLTATATSGSLTSEFGGNVTVTQSFTIGGAITTSTNAAVAGVTVTLSGGQSATATTDASGNYSFAGLTAGLNYTVTPTKASHTFTPSTLTYNALSANQTAANFTGTPTTLVIFITVYEPGVDPNDPGVETKVPLAGVTLTLTGAQSATGTTDADGSYTFTGIQPGGSYTVTPSKYGYVFDPTDLTIDGIATNESRDFTGTPPPAYTISGTAYSGGGPIVAPLAGVTITLYDSLTRTTTTDESGNYSFPGLPAGNYTVTASKPGYTFEPPEHTTPILTSDLILDFTGSAAPAPNVTLQSSASPGDSVRPGDDFTITTTFSNTGGRGAANLTIIEPLPPQCYFKVGSAYASPGSSGLTAAVLYSDDGGQTWDYTPASGAGGAPPGYDGAVTRVKFVFAGTLGTAPPDNTGAVSITAAVR